MHHAHNRLDRLQFKNVFPAAGLHPSLCNGETSGLCPVGRWCVTELCEQFYNKICNTHPCQITCLRVLPCLLPWHVLIRCGGHYWGRGRYYYLHSTQAQLNLFLEHHDTHIRTSENFQMTQRRQDHFSELTSDQTVTR